VSAMLPNLLTFLTSECTRLYSHDAAANDQFADKENVCRPLLVALWQFADMLGISGLALSWTLLREAVHVTSE
jgi:hypothetical protein